MTLEEIGRRFEIPIEKLKEYEEMGILKSQKDGYKEEDFEVLKLIDVFLKAGFALEEIKRYLNTSNQEDQIQMLRCKRKKLLEELHCRQQILDKIDFIICEKCRHQ